MCQLFRVGCSFFVVVFIFGILLMASIRRWWWDKSGFFFGMVIWINRKGQKNGSVSWMFVLFDWMIFSVSIELFLCACNKLSSILYGHLHTHNTKKIAPHVFYYTLTFSWNCTHCCCCCMPTIFEKKLMSIQIYSFTQFVTKHWDKQNERKFNNKIMVIHCNHFVCVCVCSGLFSGMERAIRVDTLRDISTCYNTNKRKMCNYSFRCIVIQSFRQNTGLLLKHIEKYVKKSMCKRNLECNNMLHLTKYIAFECVPVSWHKVHWDQTMHRFSRKWAEQSCATKKDYREREENLLLCLLLQNSQITERFFSISYSSLLFCFLWSR